MGGKGKRYKREQEFVNKVQHMGNEELVDTLLCESSANYITRRDQYRIDIMRECVLYRLKGKRNE